MNAQDYNIFTIGTVRNVEKTIINDVSNLYKFTEKFRSNQFHVVESDSSDKTLELLTHLDKTHNNFSFTSLGSLQEKYPLRTERLAFCRNFLLEWIKDKGRLKNSLIVVADLDGINTNITDNALIDSLKEINKWDAIFANQPTYYDIWALRAKGWSETDCWEEFEYLKGSMNEKKALQKAVTSKQIGLSSKNQYYPVHSAFGGLGIYKAEHYIKGEYLGVINGREVCEHVPFNESLRKKGARLFIKTDLMNKSPTDHTETPVKAVKNFIQKLTS
ncbi:MAG: hypothetical protein VW894_02010 [Gammaproteobacteria bacterium]